MTLIFYICISIFSLLLLSLFKRGTDVFSPARLFAIVWTLAISLAEMKLSRFQREWSVYSWIVLLVGLISFLGGIGVCYLANLKSRSVSANEIRAKLTRFNLNSQFLFKVILSIFFTFLLAYIVNAMAMGYIPIFTRFPAESRVGWGIFGFGLLTHLAPPILVLSCIYFVFTRDAIVQKSILILVLVVTFAADVFLLQRFDLVFGLFLIIVLLYYATYKLKMRNGLSFFLVLTTLMYGVSTIRTSKAIVNFLYYGARMKYSVKYAFLTEPYMYVSMNLENFANAVNKLDGHTYGYYTFDFILALTGLKHWLGEYLKIGEFPHLLSGSYNTYTMFFAYYRDFGIIGVCIIPFALGVIVSSQYYRLRRKPDIAGVCAYGVFVYVIIFSFFIPMLSWLHFVFNFAVILLASRLVVKRSQPPRFSPKT